MNRISICTVKNQLPKLAALGASFVCIHAQCAHAASLLTNGNFSSGLAGWTAYTTSNGTIGTPVVVSFDVTGLGPSDAVQIRAGEVTLDSTEHGGGLYQTFTGPAGDYTLSFDFASQSLNFFNLSGGLYALIFDNAVLSSFDTGDIAAFTTERGSLSGFVAGVASGTHEIRIQATRPFTTSSNSPFQYFDNVTVISSTDPQSVPSPLPLLGVAAGFRYSRVLRKHLRK